ncbi:MAG: hypothetical protein K2Q22_03750 [Cytophagales bacterium]|nr:hypothetical protein [Cytophagales bacterium]
MKRILVLTALVSALAFSYSQAGDGKDKGSKKGKKECSAAEKKECAKSEGKKSCCSHSKSAAPKTEEAKPAN